MKDVFGYGDSCNRFKRVVCCGYSFDHSLFFKGLFFFFQAEDGIRDWSVTGVQTCALPISSRRRHTRLVSDWSSDVCSSDLELQSLTNLVCRLLLGVQDRKSTRLNSSH